MNLNYIWTSVGIALLKLLKNLNMYLPKSQFVQKVMVFASGTALGQLIVLLASPLTTRLYSVEDFGIFAVFTSILAIVQAVVSWRYEMAIPLPKEDSDGMALLAISLCIVVLMSTIGAFVVFLWSKKISILFGFPEVADYLWLLPLSLLGIGFYQTLSYWAIRKQYFRQLALTKVTQNLGLTIVQLSCGFLSIAPLGLILGDVVGRFSGSSLLLHLTWKHSNSHFSSLDIKRIKENAYRYRKFPLISTISSLINAVGLQSPPILFSALFGSQVTGWFSLTQRLAAIPSALIGLAVAQVYMAELTILVQEKASLKTQKDFFIQTTKQLIRLAILPTIVALLFGEVLCSFIFGQEWREAGKYLQVLSVMFFIQFITYPTSQTLIVLEKQGWQLLWDISRCLLVVLSIYLPYRLGANAFLAISLYSLIMLIAYLAFFLMSLTAINQNVEKVKSND